MPEERRADGRLIMEMHGDIKELVAHYKNTKSHLDSVSGAVKEHAKEISSMKSHITGIKAIGSLIMIVWSGAVAVFFRKL